MSTKKLFPGELVEEIWKMRMPTYLGRFERVVLSKVYLKEEDTSLVHTAWGTEDSWCPLIHVVTFGASTEMHIIITFKATLKLLCYD